MLFTFDLRRQPMSVEGQGLSSAVLKFANVSVMKKRNHCKINACSLLVSATEQSLLRSQVQSRRASQEAHS